MFYYLHFLPLPFLKEVRNKVEGDNKNGWALD